LSKHGLRSAGLTKFRKIHHRLVVIPAELLRKIFEQLRRMFLQDRQVVERIDPFEPAGMNEAHEQVPDVIPVLGPEKEGVFTMQDNLFEELSAEGMPTA
jgi:hypothetical protein